MCESLENLKEKCTNLTNDIDYLNHNYKLNVKLSDFLSSQSSLLIDLSEKLNCSRNIISKLKRKKRKLNKETEIASKCKLKAKKLNEKHLVITQLGSSETENEKKLASISTFVPKSTPITENQFKTKLRCYICKQLYDTVHTFYDQLCPSCATFNYEKRQQKFDLNGKIALVTGCRIKIGYEICLYLLRNNCMVIGTTRFAKDAFLRYSKEPDFVQFKNLLKIYPLDLRDMSAVNKFIDYLYSNYTKLDILINNAAQTLRRNIQFYKHLLETEAKPLISFNDESIYAILQSNKPELWFSSYNLTNLAHITGTTPAQSSILAVNDLLNQNNEISLSVYESQIPLLNEDFKPNMANFPAKKYDKDLQQVDLSHVSSWNLEIDEINMIEFAEAQLINTWSPFMFCSKLKNLMCMGDYESRYIVNVSSMEGRYDRVFKPTKHSHTNMSKASLNMMTRTCGAYFAKYNIYMTSVDTGWVTEMQPEHLYEFQRTVPLDEIDGAMRVLDPIIIGLRDKINLHSIFLKDYKQITW